MSYIYDSPEFLEQLKTSFAFGSGKPNSFGGTMYFPQGQLKLQSKFTSGDRFVMKYTPTAFAPDEKKDKKEGGAPASIPPPTAQQLAGTKSVLHLTPNTEFLDFTTNVMVPEWQSKLSKKCVEEINITHMEKLKKKAEKEKAACDKAKKPFDLQTFSLDDIKVNTEDMLKTSKSSTAPYIYATFDWGKKNSAYDAKLFTIEQDKEGNLIHESIQAVPLTNLKNLMDFTDSMKGSQVIVYLSLNHATLANTSKVYYKMECTSLLIIKGTNQSSGNVAFNLGGAPVVAPKSGQTAATAATAPASAPPAATASANAGALANTSVSSPNVAPPVDASSMDVTESENNKADVY